MKTTTTPLFVAIIISFFSVGYFVTLINASTTVKSYNLCTISELFLPIVSNPDIYMSSSYAINPNNDEFEASNNGSLRSEEIYYGDLDDEVDVFSIKLPVTGTISVTVSANISDPAITYLILYSAQDYPLSIGSKIQDKFSLESNSLPPNTYFIAIFTTKTNKNTSNSLEMNKEYALIVTYPLPPSLPIPSRYRIDFPGEKIFADQGLEEAETDRVFSTIPPGIYKVWLASYDNHSEQPNPDQNEERWQLDFYDQNSVKIRSSLPITDLLSTKDCSGEEIVNTHLLLTQTVSYVRGFHSAYLSDSPNSVAPDYAILEEVLDTTSSPSP